MRNCEPYYQEIPPQGRSGFNLQGMDWLVMDAECYEVCLAKEEDAKDIAKALNCWDDAQNAIHTLIAQLDEWLEMADGRDADLGGLQQILDRFKEDINYTPRGD